MPCSANAQFPRLATLRDATQEAGLKAVCKTRSLEDLKYRHVYARIARWMLRRGFVCLRYGVGDSQVTVTCSYAMPLFVRSGVLLHTPILSSHDLKMLRELLMILAGLWAIDSSPHAPRNA